MLAPLVSYIAAVFLQCVGKTSFSFPLDHPQTLELRRLRKKAIYAFWHKNQVFLAYNQRGEDVSVLVSKSKDGEYIAQVMKRLGLCPIRGSSSKGGSAALKEIFELLDRGGQIGFTPDGPRGPVQTVHQGVIAAAVYSGAPIIPTAAYCRRKKVFNSWDKFELPLPFGVSVVGHGKPFYLSKDVPQEEAVSRVREALNDIQNSTDRYGEKLPSWAVLFFGFLIYMFYQSLSILLFPLLILGLGFKFGFKRLKQGFFERIFPPQTGSNSKNLFWFHSASIGEWQALRPILREMKKNADRRFLVTVSTPEARALIEKEDPNIQVSMAPLDLFFIVRYWARKLNPKTVFIVETEIWPALFEAVRRRLIPFYVINGRISEKGIKGWKVVPGLSTRLFSGVSFLWARSKEDLDRFIFLGLDPEKGVSVGNLKSDNLTVTSVEDKSHFRFKLTSDEHALLLVGGSTWEGEENFLLKVVSDPSLGFSKIRLILAPRKMGRINEVETIIKNYSVSYDLWSQIKSKRKWESSILLVDTLGDLNNMYKAADMTFVGGSIFPKGGQNPLEPASAATAVFFGPAMSNFKGESELLVTAKAAQVILSEADFRLTLQEMLNNRSRLKEMALYGARVIHSIQGVALKTKNKFEAEFL
ncbi:MAG: glycosyltransferase N-terminal domain-containing protein [Elusimicrobiota bacterium]